MTGIEVHLPTPYEGDDPQAEAHAITEASGTSFSGGMNILPTDRRNAMHAIYAFSRQVDDIADGPWSSEDKHKALDAWRAEIEALYAGAPSSAVGKALAPAIVAYELPKEEFLGLIDGMAMDADGPIVAPPRKELSLYTRRVAGTVGLLSIRVFGAWKSEASDRFALALADALQITNILRDVEEDAGIDRLYLPSELLAKHGLTNPTPHDVAAANGLDAIRAELGEEAKAFYNEARSLAPLHDRKALRPALMMMGAYEGYLIEMERRRWRLSPDVKLQSRWQKLFRGLRYAFMGPGQPTTS